MKTPERKIELAQRRILQRNRTHFRHGFYGLHEYQMDVRGKYIPAGVHKNTQPHNR